jgi:hypothetical protein
MRILLLSCICLAALSFFSCKKQVEIFQTDAVTDYVPLSAGKYITYRVDSTIFTNFGRTTEVHSYQVKHVIDTTFTDNLGRKSYRVYRFLRDTAATQAWTPAGSYFITATENQVEVVEDNLRFIKLHGPVKKDFQWRGNAYLGVEPYISLFAFTNDDDLESWEYSYQNINDVFQYKQQTLSNVIKVVQIDERYTLDTVDVVNNKVTIPKNSEATYIRGNATDTVRITASKPDPGHEKLTVYNQSNSVASLSSISIPSSLALSYEYSYIDTLNKWYYPNPVTVLNNRVAIGRDAYTTYIFGAATDSIKINVQQVDTFNTKKLTIYNKSNFTAYLNGIPIPPGFGRNYELRNAQWNYYNGLNILLDKDPYIADLPFGSTNYSVEQYAKNIGLVYKEIIMWDYQPNPGSPSGAYKTGFGIKMTMIDHN